MALRALISYKQISSGELQLRALINDDAKCSIRALKRPFSVTTVRTFCSTCQLLNAPPFPKNGEPSKPSSRSRTIMDPSLARRSELKRKDVSAGPLEGSTNRGATEKGRPFVKSGRMAFLQGYGGKSPTSTKDYLPSVQDLARANDAEGEVTHLSIGGANRRTTQPGTRLSNRTSMRYGNTAIDVKGTRSEEVMSSPTVMMQGRDQLQQQQHQRQQVAERKTKFIGIDLESSLSKIFLTKLPLYRSPLFNLRAFPSHLLPPRRPPPFPLDFGQHYRKENDCVQLAVIGSKSQVSKLAVERNRARRRFRAAMEMVVEGEEKGLVVPEYTYIASLTAEIHDAPFQQITDDILTGLRYLKKVQPRRGGGLPEPRYIPRGIVVPAVNVVPM
nr:ribonuclease P protein component [Kwoniella shandongensis]KAA5531030.1 ribonuclease P protein component [Kwoniella shandongensis]